MKKKINKMISIDSTLMQELEENPSVNASAICNESLKMFFAAKKQAEKGTNGSRETAIGNMIKIQTEKEEATKDLALIHKKSNANPLNERIWLNKRDEYKAKFFDGDLREAMNYLLSWEKENLNGNCRIIIHNR